MRTEQHAESPLAPAGQEGDRWASEILMQAIDAELSRRTRVVDRGHAALLVYAAEAWAIASAVEFYELSVLSKVSCYVLAFCSLFVLFYWHRMSKVQPVEACDPEVFGEMAPLVTPWSKNPATVRCHLQEVLAGIQASSKALSSVRAKLHETMLVAMIAGGVPLVEQFFLR